MKIEKNCKLTYITFMGDSSKMLRSHLRNEKKMEEVVVDFWEMAIGVVFIDGLINTVKWSYY